MAVLLCTACGGTPPSSAPSSAPSSSSSSASAAPSTSLTPGPAVAPVDGIEAEAVQLRTGSGGSADVPLVAVRRGAKVDVFVGNCSHMAGPLQEGQIEEVRGHTCLVCPWHGSAFDLDDGEPRRGPAANPQEKLEVRMDAGHVLARLPARHQ